MDVEARNLALTRAAFEQWLAWWESHPQGRTIDEQQLALMREAYFAGWGRSQQALEQGWANDETPPALRLDGAINRMVSRK